MEQFTISTPRETATLRLTCRGGGAACELHADFLPLEQPRFIDAVERKYQLERITKDGAGGCTLTFHATREQRAAMLEEMAALLEDNYEERYA